MIRPSKTNIVSRSTTREGIHRYPDGFVSIDRRSESRERRISESFSSTVREDRADGTWTAAATVQHRKRDLLSSVQRRDSVYCVDRSAGRGVVREEAEEEEDVDVVETIVSFSLRCASECLAVVLRLHPWTFPRRETFDIHSTRIEERNVECEVELDSLPPLNEANSPRVPD